MYKWTSVRREFKNWIDFEIDCMKNNNIKMRNTLDKEQIFQSISFFMNFCKILMMTDENTQQILTTNSPVNWHNETTYVSWIKAYLHEGGKYRERYNSSLNWDISLAFSLIYFENI